MEIRKSTSRDLETILWLIDEGRKKMVAQGNLKQWSNGHPTLEQIEIDIAGGNSYLVEDEGRAIATFALIEGPDPTYSVVYNGAWLDDSPYYVIHRIASCSGVHGILQRVVEYAFTKTKTVRIDTHEDNIAMRNLMKKLDFVYCGIIHLANGDPRLAYQKTIV